MKLMERCDQTSELLRVLGGGALSREATAELAAHLRLCSRCFQVLKEFDGYPGDQEFQAGLDLAGGYGRIPQAAYSGILDRVFEGIVEENQRIEDQRSSAPALLQELLVFSRGQRDLLAKNTRKYHVWALVEEALSEARRGWTEDPTRSEELSLLAVEITNHLKASGFRARLLNDLKAEAWSSVANCRRIQSDYGEARAAFKEAEELLAEGSGDRLEWARLMDLKASLYVDLGELHGAEKLLDQSIDVYRSAGDLHSEGRALMKRAKVLRASGRVEEAVPILQRAASLVDVVTEPQLVLALRNNLISYLSEAGRAKEAQKLLPEFRLLAKKQGTRLERLRFLWTEGILRKELGQPELTTEIMEQVREGFIAAGIGYDVALVSLDLAAVYLESGRTERARALARESIPLFTSRGVHRRALVAWNLFREAAERDALTLGLVQEVASRIRQSQSRPAAGGDLA